MPIVAPLRQSFTYDQGKEMSRHQESRSRSDDAAVLAGATRDPEDRHEDIARCRAARGAHASRTDTRGPEARAGGAGAHGEGQGDAYRLGRGHRFLLPAWRVRANRRIRFR